MARVRHYTRKSSKDQILADGEIKARDQNKVFVEFANADPYGPQDAEARYGLKRGKGKAYVEFDAEDDEIMSQRNSLTGKLEYYLKGDFDLTNRDPEGFDNV